MVNCSWMFQYSLEAVNPKIKKKSHAKIDHINWLCDINIISFGTITQIYAFYRATKISTLTSASTLSCKFLSKSLNFLNFGLIGAIWWKIISSATWLSREWSFVSTTLIGELTSCCDVDAVEGGDGGVCLGVVPLHCISRRMCSARHISAASQDGNSGRTFNFIVFS